MRIVDGVGYIPLSCINCDRTIIVLPAEEATRRMQEFEYCAKCKANPSVKKSS
jgi:hypothetical protein